MKILQRFIVQDNIHAIFATILNKFATFSSKSIKCSGYCSSYVIKHKTVFHLAVLKNIFVIKRNVYSITQCFTLLSAGEKSDTIKKCSTNKLHFDLQ